MALQDGLDGMKSFFMCNFLGMRAVCLSNIIIILYIAVLADMQSSEVMLSLDGLDGMKSFFMCNFLGMRAVCLSNIIIILYSGISGHAE